jgi:hypothetical protein
MNIQAMPARGGSAFGGKNLFRLCFLNLMLLPSFALAADDHGLSATQSAAGLPIGDVPTFLGQIAGAALALAGSIFLFLVIYGGIMIMTSAGSDRVEKGKKIITWAVIGALLLGASYAITALVFSAISSPGTPAT